MVAPPPLIVAGICVLVTGHQNQRSETAASTGGPDVRALRVVAPSSSLRGRDGWAELDREIPI
eukprot:4002945-Pyramimonas_sp.AAC.1